MEFFLLLLYGMLFGFSSVIPGVSGGTMLTAFGAHEKVRNALCFLKPKTDDTEYQAENTAGSYDTDEQASPERKPKTALITLLIGMLTGIGVYIFALSTAFSLYATACYLFFTGFIVGSLPLAFRAATKYDLRTNAKGEPVPFFKRVTAGNIALFVIAATATVIVGMMNQSVTPDYTLTQSLDPNDSSVTVVTLTNHTTSDISDWRITFPEGGVTAAGNAKLVREESLPEMVTGWLNPQDDNENERSNAFVSDDSEAIKPGSSVIFTYKSRMADRMKMEAQVTYAMSFTLFFRLMVGVFAAAFAVIIPGISGSHVMMLSGIYATVMSALQRVDVLVLLPVIIGAALGLYAGASTIKNLIERYETTTYSIILGLYVGSIYVVFPKEIDFGAELFIGIGLGIFGAALAVTLGAEKKAAWELKSTGKNL